MIIGIVNQIDIDWFSSFRVMVLDAGMIKEFDSPNNLLKNTDSIFYGMAKDAGLVS